MNTTTAPVTTEEIRKNDLAVLAYGALGALCVDGKEFTAELIMERTIGQACIEIEAVERALEHESSELVQLAFILTGIRKRLDFAAENGEMLAKLIAEGGTP